MSDSLSKLKEVLSSIEKDTAGAEFNFAIFSAALLSYRKNTCLRPYPNCYGDNEIDNFEHLISVFETIPPLADLKKDVLSEETLKLIDWICCSKKISVTLCQKDEVLKTVQEKTGESSFSIQPDQIYEIRYNSGTQMFNEMKEKYGIKYGYHGSRLDNFYSIINNGLQVHMMKNGLFGEGIYLSDDLSVTMPYTKNGTVWKHSLIGEQISCVALCELIDHPGVKCQVENDTSKRRSSAKNSESGEVPERYFVVTRSELVRVKYILVFSDRKTKKKIVFGKNPWICQKYPVACILIVYGLFLVLMGVWKSRWFQLFYNRQFKDKSDDNDF